MKCSVVDVDRVKLGAANGRGDIRSGRHVSGVEYKISRLFLSWGLTSLGYIVRGIVLIIIWRMRSESAGS
jgi:hypothetical protein